MISDRLGTTEGLFTGKSYSDSACFIAQFGAGVDNIDVQTAVQRGITRLAADTDLTVIDNSLVREGLEDVFMRLVDTKERAA